MRFALFLLICFSFPYCFAQTNPMEYFYKGRCETPDFAALAVLENQHCPRSIAFEGKEYGDLGDEYEEYEKQICTSRYQIIRILDAVSDTLNKKYLEIKEKPVLSNFRHRPMLIFGKHKNGIIQIEGREEISEYFDPFSFYEPIINYQNLEFFPIVGHLYEIYGLHSIGTPYYSLKNLDSLDKVYYSEYLMPYYKQHVEVAGKNFGELLLRLTQNRKPIKATKINNKFTALGAIESVRPASDPKRANFYELNVTIETIFKNDAKIDSNIAIFIDKEYLPLGWGCLPLNSLSLYYRTPFYLFGDLKDGSLFIDSLVSTRDIFVFKDTVYDISMGLLFKELLTYFLPSNISFEEFKFGKRWNNPERFAKIQDGIFPESMASVPECLKKDILETAIKWEGFFGKNSYRKQIFKNKQYNEDVESLFSLSFLNEFRCRNLDVGFAPFMVIDSIVEIGKGGIHIFTSNYGKERPCERCKKEFIPRGYGVWGRK